MDSLLQKKLNYLIDIKNITAAYDFKGNENEADMYISMINKREYILNKINGIDILLENKKKSGDASIKSQIEAVAKDIVEMDKRNKIFVDKIKNSLLLKINEVKRGKEVSTAYNHYSNSPVFDSKR